MKIDNFQVDNWLNTREEAAAYNLSSSYCKPVTVEELLKYAKIPKDTFFRCLWEMSLEYGNPLGSPTLKQAVAGLYTDVVTTDMVITVHGGTGANIIIFTALCEKGDNIVSVLPNYQQHYSIPEALGLEVRRYVCRREKGYAIDMEEIESMVDHHTKMIVLSNPANPTGYALSRKQWEALIKIAQKVDAYILCDEIYRGLTGAYMDSVCDLYEKGISSGSVSKALSGPGLRVGWIVIRDLKVKEKLMNLRSYISLCEGPINEGLATLILENKDLIYQRNQKLVEQGKAVLLQWIAKERHYFIPCESRSATAFVCYDFSVPAENFAQDGPMSRFSAS